MNVFKSNLDFLENEFPELFRVVIDYITDENYEVVTTKNNEHNLHIKKEEEVFFLHSKYNARTEAVKWLLTVKDDTKNGQVLLFGLGMGYFLEAVLLYSDAEQIIVYEPDINIFNQMVRSNDISSILSDPRVKMFAVGDHELVLRELAYYISTKLTGVISIVAAPIYQRIYKETLTQLEEQINAAVINEASNQQTHGTFNKQWIENILFNLPYTIKYPSFNSFKNVWKGQKAIIVGSGPSLQQDAHYLKRLKNKCLIIAAGSSVQALQYYGIEPDLVVTMDGGDANYRVFQNIDTSRSPLLFITQTHHKILDIYNNELVYAIFSEDQVSKYVLPTLIPSISFLSTASVTGTALQAAAYMGIDEIYLMGQDLSYPNNQFYSPGVNHISEKSKKQSIDNADEWVQNVDGGMNLSSKIMIVTRKDIELTIKTLALAGIKVTNTSKGGAVIEGGDWIAIEELLPCLESLPDNDFNIGDMISNCIPQNQEEAVSRTKNKLNYILKQLNEVERKLDKLAAIIQDLNKNHKNRNVKQINQILLRLNDLWQWITKKDVFVFFYSFGLSQYINDYMKYVPKIVETNNSIEKAELISQHLGILINKMINFSPDLKNIISLAVSRLDNFVFEVNERN